MASSVACVGTAAFADRVRSVLASQLGAEVVTNPSIGSAKPTVKRDNIDCIVSQCRLPDADETTIIERLRSVAPMTPLVLCSSEAREQLAVRAARRDGVKYLPTDAGSRPQELLACVESFVREDSRQNRDSVQSRTVERVGRLVRNLTHEAAVSPPDGATEKRTDRPSCTWSGRREEDNRRQEDDSGRVPPGSSDNEQTALRHTDRDASGTDTPAARTNGSAARSGDDSGEAAAALPSKAFEEACRGLAELVEATHAVIYRYDGVDSLVPVAWTARDSAPDRPEDVDTTSPVWDVFESGEARIERSDRLGCELLLPVGSDGLVRLTHSDSRAFTEGDLAVGRVYVPTLETIFDRAGATTPTEPLDDTLDDLAGVISHDLQNPLSVALGHIDSLEASLGDNESLDKLKQSLEHMERVVDDTLHFASDSELVGETSVVSLERSAEWSWSLVEPKTATLTVESDLEFEADTDRLNQLLENLFRNAVTHAGPEVHVTVGALEDGSGFYVGDDGPGIPPGRREAVFDLGHTTSDDGTGFGLATVARIADAHGWSVECAESASEGARFLVRF